MIRHDAVEAASVETGLPGTSVRTAWVHVTPRVAAAYLAMNHDNRHLSAAVVRRLSEEMKAGLWRHTHQGIAFDDSGALIDGQHRLTAILSADVAQWMLVTEGLPRKAQEAMDGGKKRSVGDFLENPFANDKAAAARLLVATDRCRDNLTESRLHYTLGNITTPEVMAVVDQEPYTRLPALATAARAAAKSVPAFGPSPLLAAVALLIEDEDAQGEYLRGYSEMVGMDEGDPRISLMRYRGVPGERIQQARAFSHALRVTYAWREGRPLKVLKRIPASMQILPKGVLA